MVVWARVSVPLPTITIAIPSLPDAAFNIVAPAPAPTKEILLLVMLIVLEIM